MFTGKKQLLILSKASRTEVSCIHQNLTLMSWRPQCPAGQRCLFAQIINAHLPGQDMADLSLCGLSSSPNHLTGDRERPGKELRSLRLSEMFTWIRFSVWCGRSGTVSGNSWGKTLSVACVLSNMQWSFLTWDRILYENAAEGLVSDTE